MKLKMAENSLFAILLRSPWWVSIAVAVAVIAALRLVVPEIYAAFFALPFLGIGVYAGWKQLRAPSTASVERALDEIRAMAWEDFAAALEKHFAGDGYTVTRLAGEEADFEMSKSGRIVLVACKRWKATRTGVEPLRQLHAAGRKREAAQCIYVAAGEITENAREFAAKSNMRLIHSAELARFRK
jgi:restriction system protein